jgi:hypothetical protein
MMGIDFRLLLFGPVQSSLRRALWAPARRARPAADPASAIPAPESGADFDLPDDPALREAAVTILMASTFTSAGH